MCCFMLHGGNVRARTGAPEILLRGVASCRGNFQDDRLGHAAFIVGLIEDRKDITLNEMVERLAADRAVPTRRSALSVWLRGRGWTFKNVWPAPSASGVFDELTSLRQRIHPGCSQPWNAV